MATDVHEMQRLLMRRWVQSGKRHSGRSACKQTRWLVKPERQRADQDQRDRPDQGDELASARAAGDCRYAGHRVRHKSLDLSGSLHKASIECVQAIVCSVADFYMSAT